MSQCSIELKRFSKKMWRCEIAFEIGLGIYGYDSETKRTSIDNTKEACLAKSAVCDMSNTTSIS